MGLGTGEIILIIVVIMVVFGGSKLPQLGDGLGRAIGSFKRAISGANEIVVSAKKSEIDGAAKPEKQESAKPTEKAPDKAS
jgi:sec-independent protein translocase protein TatA